AAEQIALADLILLSKTDLAPEGEDRKGRIQEIEAKIRAINPAAPIVATTMGVIPNAELFRERRFFAAPDITYEHTGHDHADHDHTSHIAGISSVVLRTDTPIDIDRLYSWIGDLQNSLGPNLLRYKGIIYSDEYSGKRAILQGVHVLYTVTPDRAWHSNEKRESVIVVIGQDLDHQVIEQGFKRSLAG
ncbi:MAG: GTP-binding protein, partial [Candidatus Moraniibacteriota bacterium]